MEVNGQLYPRGKSSRYPLVRRLGGTQSRSGHSGGVEKRSYHCPYQEFNPGHPTCSLVTILTELPPLPSGKDQFRSKTFLC